MYKKTSTYVSKLKQSQYLKVCSPLPMQFSEAPPAQGTIAAPVQSTTHKSSLRNSLQFFHHVGTTGKSWCLVTSFCTYVMLVRYSLFPVVSLSFSDKSCHPYCPKECGTGLELVNEHILICKIIQYSSSLLSFCQCVCPYCRRMTTLSFSLYN